jgi:hypothetical protein
MPTTTTCRHYPYPLDPDPPNVASDIGKLARAIDTDACTLAARLSNAENTALNAVKRTGDAMTGSLVIATPAAYQLALRRSGTSVDQPTISFQSLAGTPQFGTIMGDAGGLNFKVDSTADSHTFLVGTTERLVVDSGGVNVTGLADVAGSVAARNTGGNQLYLVDTNGGNNCYLSLYGAGTSTTTGAQSAAIGFSNSTALLFANNYANGQIRITTQGNGEILLDTENAGDITLSCGVGGEINFTPNGGFQGKMTSGGLFMWGKSASDLSNPGIEMFGAGSSAEGAVRSTVNQASLANLYLRHESAANAEGQPFIQFMSASTELARAQQDATAPVGLHFSNTTTTAPSDYRLKNDLGPITDALMRVARLRPRRITWKDHPDGREQDAFIAHEVAYVVPEAVRGVKDAMTEAGEVDPQQLEVGRLVPLLTAAILELLDRVEALEDHRG